MACCEVLFGTVPPTASPTEAQIPIYIDRTSKKVYYWNGTGWELIWEIQTAGVGTPGVVSIDPNSPIYVGEGGTLQINCERLKTQCGFATVQEVSEAVSSAINELVKSLNTSLQGLDSRITSLSNTVSQVENALGSLAGRVSSIEAWDLCAKTSSCGHSTGGVTKLIAGTNITLSPASGTGEVTINAAGSSGGSGGGIAAVTMTSADLTLTALQYGKPIIVLSGALTANLNLIFPAIAGEWTVVNNCTGSYTVTCKTAAGTGAVITPGCTRIIFGDGTNIAGSMNEVETPKQFNNSTLLATTAFVQRAIGGFGQLLGYGTTGQTIPASAANSHINIYGTCSSITLPLANSVPAGSVLMFDGVSRTCTINRQGTNVIFLNGTNTSATSVVVADGETVMLTSDGSGSWFASGIATLKYAAGFGSSLAAAGYQKLPSGLIAQWGPTGAVSSASAAVTVTFPIAFPTACMAIAFGPNATHGVMVAAESIAAANFAYSAFASGGGRIAGMGTWFIAIGK